MKLRKVTFGVGNSLDGYIARADHGVDWLQWTKEIGEISANYWKTIDTVVMGRKTYEKSPGEGFPGVKNYVFSRTLPAKARGPVRIVNTDPAKFVAKLKKGPGKGIDLKLLQVKTLKNGCVVLFYSIRR